MSKTRGRSKRGSKHGPRKKVSQVDPAAEMASNAFGVLLGGFWSMLACVAFPLWELIRYACFGVWFEKRKP